MNLITELLQPTRPADMPLHVGESYFLWRYLTTVMAARTLCQLLKNHTRDKELRGAIDAFIKDVEEPQIKTLTELMHKEGIAFPQFTPDKPAADELAIPAGAKFEEVEIANLLVVKIEGLVTLANMSMLQSLRNDIATMFLQFEGQLMPVGLKMKQVMSDKGWLVVPPNYKPPGLPS